MKEPEESERAERINAKAERKNPMPIENRKSIHKGLFSNATKDHPK
jgi:hypothetical protein